MAKRIRVTFKDEDERGGQIIGPVTVFDLDRYEKDPEVAKADLGWMSLSQARKVARDYGVELEEV